VVFDCCTVGITGFVARARMDFCILGPLEALDEGRVVELGGSKQRALLALLLLHANETLSTDRLIDELWGERPPATAAKTVQVHISRLRKALAGAAGDGAACDGMVVTRQHGYELQLDPERLDACDFERLVGEGSSELAAGRPERAAAALEGALSLWRGTPLADLAYERFAQVEIARLGDLRVNALELLIDAKLALGAHAEVVGRLEALIAEHPFRERLHAQLMLALYRSDRQADALQAYQDARSKLHEELAIAPGERLRELERAILAQDPALALKVVERPPEPDTAERRTTLVERESGSGPANAETRPPGMAASVVGREAELAAVDSVLAAALEGLRLLVIEGDPGIGKTTVWRAGVARAGGHGYRVLSCRAAPAETRLSFAGLTDLLTTVDTEAFNALPGPQRRALDVALLRAEAEGPAPDPRAIGTGVVSLVSALAADAPVLLALDDVQWLDRPTARALEFALRRLDPLPVAVLATLRVGGGDSPVALLAAAPADRVRRLRLGPLRLDALYEVLKEQLGRALTPPLLGRVERASHGNPFYALELARALDAEGLPSSGEALPVPEDMRELVAGRLRSLPQRTRDELLKASALAQPTVSLIDPAKLVPAIEAGVVSVRSKGRIEFVHPLFAGAVHAGASRERRRRLHGELAELVTDLEERARHLSLATDGPDERVACVLEEAADLADRRGAPEVAAELLEQAAQRTPAAAAVRWQRYLRAAREHLRAGDRERARALGERVVAASDARSLRAQGLYLLAEVVVWERPPAAVPLLERALACVGNDVGLAAQLETSLGYVFGGTADPARADLHLGRGVDLAERAGDDALLAQAIALRALTRLLYGVGVDERGAERALDLEDRDRAVPFQLRVSLNVAQFYEFTHRLESARELFVGVRDRLVARGAESDLPFVLAHLAGTAWPAGELERAECEADEALRAAALTGEEVWTAAALMIHAMVRAIRGDGARARADAARTLEICARTGWPLGIAQARWAQALLALSEGDARAAAVALEPVVAMVESLGVYGWPLAMALPDAIAALVAIGELDRADRLTTALTDWGRRSGLPWPLAMSGRSRALLDAARGDLESAQAAAERALAEHERLPMPFERARTLLVLGTLQRRRGQRRAARDSLQRALALFEELGAPAWAEKARGEARRIGVRRAPAELTENEQLVAQLAANGLTNREIAAQMFLSRRTVEANLARAYRKLGIHSRAELGATMAKRNGISTS
jgi:DNA-binding SARP family transcriptional activator/DNA-binding CsgD family transcriptional regulator